MTILINTYQPVITKITGILLVEYILPLNNKANIVLAIYYISVFVTIWVQVQVI